MLKSIVKFIPNLLTLLNLMAGVSGIMLILSDRPQWAFLCLLIGLVADFLDGFAARLLKVSGPLGVQLDSLADLITFGLLPVVLFFHLAAEAGEPLIQVGIVAVVFPAFAAFRLARFNISDHPGPDFSGLPSPAAGLTAMAICWSIFQNGESLLPEIQTGPVTSLIVLAVGFLMVTNFRFLSLKFKSLNFYENILKYLLFTGVLISLIVFGTNGILPAVIWYFLLSAISNFFP
jgi:CDP-diacylglycerol---serine O-phosphatidyltransferase